MAQRAVREGLSGSASRWLRAVTAVGVALTLLVGCAESTPAPGPRVMTPRPTTEQPAPGPEVDVQERPVAPEPRTGTPDERDAEDAAEFFVELYNYAVATGDIAEWEERSDPDCGFCSSTVDEVTRYADERLTYVGGEFKAEEPEFISLEPTLFVFGVQVPVVAEPATGVTGDGEVVERFDGDEGYLGLELGYTPADGWTLVRLGFSKEPFA